MSIDEELKEAMAKVKMLKKQKAEAKKKKEAEDKAKNNLKAKLRANDYEPPKTEPVKPKASKPKAVASKPKAKASKPKGEKLKKILNKNMIGYFDLYMVKQADKKTYKNHVIKARDGLGYVKFFTGFFAQTAAFFANFDLRAFYTQAQEPHLVKMLKDYLMSVDYPEHETVRKFLQSYNIDGFEFTRYDREQNDFKKVDVLNDKLHEDADNSVITSKYTKYISNLESQDFGNLLSLDLIDYLKDENNFRPNSCLLTVIINKFYDRFNIFNPDGSRKYKELTYDRLCELLDMPNDKAGNIGCSILHAVEHFFKRFNFASLYVFDPFMNLLLKHEATDKRNTSLYIIVHNKHVYQMNDNINSLSQKVVDVSDKVELNVSDKFQIKNTKAFDEILEYFVSEENLIIKTMADAIKKIKETREALKKKVVPAEVKENEEQPAVVQDDRELFINDEDEEEPDEADIIPDDEDLEKVQPKSLDKFKHLEKVRIIKIITPVKMNDILLKLVKDGYTPKANFHTTLYQLSFKVDDFLIQIEACDDNPIYGKNVSFFTLNSYKAYNEASNTLYEKLIKSEYVSEHHSSTQKIEDEYKIRPLVGYFGERDNNPMDAVDETKAYTQCLISIKQIPVFDKFDVYNNYDKHEIEDLTYYVIRVLDDSDKTRCLFNHKISRTYGFVLKQTKIPYEILYYRRPSKIIDVDFQTPIEELYKNDEIDVDKKKTIVNKMTGLMETKLNHSYNTKVFKLYSEAIHYLIKYDGQLMHITSSEKDNNERVYIVNVKADKRLVNGMSPVKDMIYQLQRLKMYFLYINLKLAGAAILGARTDCLYYRHGRDIKKYVKLSDDEKAIGAFKIETHKFLPDTQISFLENELIDIKDFTKPDIKIFADERDTKTINAFINMTRNVLICGEYAGVGKTEIVKRLKAKSPLFVCPYNKLCQTLRKDKFEAITFNKLLGLYGCDQEVKTMKRYDISKHDVIAFDEIFLYDPRRLARINQLIEANPDKIFIGMGDNNQCPAIGYDSEEGSAYLKNCMNVLFPKQILLKEIKRLQNPEDIKRMVEIKADSLNRDMLIEDVCKKHRIKIIRRLQDLKTTTNICYFNYRCDEVNKHVHFKLLKYKEKFIKGIELICRKHIKLTAAKVLNTNYTFKIMEVEEDKLHLKDEVDNIDYYLSNELVDKCMKLPYAMTCPTVQGCTLGADEKITIFDANLPYTTREYFYTAITRVQYLDNITVFIHDEDEVFQKEQGLFKRYLKEKIEGYKQQDKKANRPVGEDYIDVNWFSEQMKKSNACRVCFKTFEIIPANGSVKSDLTVDRKNSSLSHTKLNCHLVCHSCNSHKSNRFNSA